MKSPMSRSAIATGVTLAIAAALVCLFLFDDPDNPTKYCQSATESEARYKQLQQDNARLRSSRDYVPINTRRDMDQREETAKGMAQQAEYICERSQIRFADGREYSDLSAKFDVDRFSRYTAAEKKQVISLTDTGGAAPGSFNYRLALLRTFRDHPDLYH